jgi:hypothetical protein
MSGEKHDRLEMKYIPVADIEANSWNAQGMDSVTFQRLKDEIGNVGFIEPMQVVLLDTGKYRIIGGEHRWQAARELGMTEVPAAILPGKRWAETDLQKFVTVRLNVLKGNLDPQKFALLYSEMADKYGADALQGLMGFTDAKAFAKILGGLKKELKKILPKDMHAKLDEASHEAKTVQDLGNIVQMMFAKYGETVNQNFMIFSYGKSDHLYISMSKPMKKAMDKVTDYCRTTGSDINSILEPLAQEWVKKVTANLEIQAKEAAEKTPKYAKEGGDVLKDTEF